jgi:NAD-dependent SIR2 family protein deacetylase
MSGRYGITLGYEKDTCSICKKKKEVRLIYDREKHLVVKVCDECAGKLNMPIDEVVKKYGEKTTAKHIQILTKEQLEKSGFDVKGLKEKAA